MRQTLILWLTLVSFASFAQRPNTKVDVGNTVPIANVAGNEVDLMRLQREGMAFKASSGPITSNQSSNTISFGTDILGGITLTINPGRAGFITSISAGCTAGPSQVYGSSNIRTKVFSALPLSGQAISGLDIPFGTYGGNVTATPNMLIGAEGKYDVRFKWLGAQNSPYPYCSATIYYTDFTADFHFDARNILMVVGESTSWGSMESDPGGVAYPGEDLYPFRLVDSLRYEGKSFRLVNKSFGSAQSGDADYARRSNWYDVDYDVMIVNMSINDAGQGTTQANYQDRLKKFILHRNKHRPKASILFVGCPPTDVNVANYRTWMQAVATDATLGGTARKVYWVDASSAFAMNATATADLNYATTNRVAGQRIHPNSIGQFWIHRAIYPVLKTVDAVVNAK